MKILTLYDDGSYLEHDSMIDITYNGKAQAERHDVTDKTDEQIRQLAQARGGAIRDRIAKQGKS